MYVEHTLDGISKALELEDSGFMEILARPIRENEETHKKANGTSYGYGVETFICHFQHFIHTITWDTDQIESQ